MIQPPPKIPDGTAAQTRFWVWLRDGILAARPLEVRGSKVHRAARGLAHLFKK